MHHERRVQKLITNLAAFFLLKRFYHRWKLNYRKQKVNVSQVQRASDLFLGKFWKFWQTKMYRRSLIFVKVENFQQSVVSKLFLGRILHLWKKKWEMKKRNRILFDDAIHFQKISMFKKYVRVRIWSRSFLPFFFWSFCFSLCQEENRNARMLCDSFLLHHLFSGSSTTSLVL